VIDQVSQPRVASFGSAKAKVKEANGPTDIRNLALHHRYGKQDGDHVFSARSIYCWCRSKRFFHQGETFTFLGFLL
jgi:hypothetical protein